MAARYPKHQATPDFHVVWVSSRRDPYPSVGAPVRDCGVGVGDPGGHRDHSNPIFSSTCAGPHCLWWGLATQPNHDETADCAGTRPDFAFFGFPGRVYVCCCRGGPDWAAGVGCAPNPAAIVEFSDFGAGFFGDCGANSHRCGGWGRLCHGGETGGAADFGLLHGVCAGAGRCVWCRVRGHSPDFHH